MRIYGADFSGARDPSKGIFYASGELSDSTFTIDHVRQCDDRLDLFAAIVDSSAPWALDFPFSLSEQAMRRIGVSDWGSLLALAASMSRGEFADYLAHWFPESCEGRCQQHDLCCRVTDVESNAFSPLKRNNPNMRAMIYGGLKLLYYLRGKGVTVFPFDRLSTYCPRVYELYPSHTWKSVGIRRSSSVEGFATAFNEFNELNLKLGKNLQVLESADAADAFVACATLGTALYHYESGSSSDRQPKCVSDNEWEARSDEGLVIRIPE